MPAPAGAPRGPRSVPRPGREAPTSRRPTSHSRLPVFCTLHISACSCFFDEVRGVQCSRHPSDALLRLLPLVHSSEECENSRIGAVSYGSCCQHLTSTSSLLRSLAPGQQQGAYMCANMPAGPYPLCQSTFEDGREPLGGTESGRAFHFSAREAQAADAGPAPETVYWDHLAHFLLHLLSAVLCCVGLPRSGRRLAVVAVVGARLKIGRGMARHGAAHVRWRPCTIWTSIPCLPACGGPGPRGPGRGPPCLQIGQVVGSSDHDHGRLWRGAEFHFTLVEGQFSTTTPVVRAVCRVDSLGIKQRRQRYVCLFVRLPVHTSQHAYRRGLPPCGRTRMCLTLTDLQARILKGMPELQYIAMSVALERRRCMYACMHACMHACMYVCMYVWMYVRM